MAERLMKVKGTALRYQDWGNNWREQTGTLTGETGTAGPGDTRLIRIVGDRLYYIDYNLDERYLPYEIIAGSDIAKKIKVKGNWIRYVKTTGDIREWHEDIPHTDTPYTDTGYDKVHTNTGHIDTHKNTGYSDAHTNTGHDDAHYNSGYDRAHDDNPHFDYIDGGPPEHYDVPHTNSPHQDDHYDGYSDTHTNVPHQDDHYDGYYDTHANVPHQDDHTDIPAHNDVHEDRPELV